ncbi:MAG: DUF4167 domain-containing protein [Pseudomonadota bacterium]|nr:DUF4167 domain-containing protein [Pseudomonadota bacterium]
MKQSSNSRRSRGRGVGKRQPKNNSFDSNGPEVRVRGSAQQVYEKYLTLARDARAVGDRIASENYFQHAEHYFRIIGSQENGDSRDGGRDTNRNEGRSRRGRSHHQPDNQGGNATQKMASEVTADQPSTPDLAGAEQPSIELPPSKDPAAAAQATQPVPTENSDAESENIDEQDKAVVEQSGTAGLAEAAAESDTGTSSDEDDESRDSAVA